MKSSTTFGNLPSGINLSAGLLMVYCSTSKMPLPLPHPEHWHLCFFISSPCLPWIFSALLRCWTVAFWEIKCLGGQILNFWSLVFREQELTQCKLNWGNTKWPDIWFDSILSPLYITANTSILVKRPIKVLVLEGLISGLTEKGRMHVRKLFQQQMFILD